MATGLSAKTAQKTDGATEEPKKSKKFNHELWIGASTGSLVSRELCEGSDDTRAAAYRMEFENVMNGLVEEEFDNAVDAVNSFESWLDKTDWRYTEPVLYTGTGMSITLSMSAPSGTIAVQMSFIPSDWSDLQGAIVAVKKDLQKAVAASFPHNGKQQSAPQSKSNGPKRAKVETEEVTFDTLVIDEYNGKPIARLIPTEGKWTQYGVPLYNADAAKIGIDLPEEQGEYEISGTMIYELKQDGKPKRVISAELDE